MGGRISVALSALQYSLRTGRELVIDWNDYSYYSPRIADVFAAFWERPVATPFSPDRFASLSVYPEVWEDKILDYRNDVNAEIMPYALSFFAPPDDGDLAGTEAAERADVVVVTRNSSEAQIRSLYREIVPNRFIQARLGIFRDRHQWNRMIGVQIRHGNGEPYLQPASTDWFHAKIAELRAVDKGLGIFLATDSHAVVEEFEQTYGRVVHVPKWYPPPGSGSMHQNGDCPDRFESGVAAIVDMWLLAECSTMLLCKGFFGAAARLVSGIDSEHVQVYPGKIHATREEKAAWDNPI